MEKYINPLQGEFGSSHVKQGIIARDRNRRFIGLVTQSSKGYHIVTPFHEHLGGEQSLNLLLIRFTNTYTFYLL